MLRLHVASTSNQITLIGDHMKNELLPNDTMSNNQTTTDIQLSLTDSEGLFLLMFRLYVASTSNEITFAGDHMKSDLFPTGIMSVLRQSNND